MALAWVKSAYRTDALCIDADQSILHTLTVTAAATKMSEEDIAEEIRTLYPDAEEVIVQYLSGYLVDDAVGDEEDVLDVARQLLVSLSGGEDDALKQLMARLTDLLKDQLHVRAMRRQGPKLQKLEKVLDMSKAQMSSTIALSEGVDLESINKGKCVIILLVYRRGIQIYTEHLVWT